MTPKIEVTQLAAQNQAANIAHDSLQKFAELLPAFMPNDYQPVELAPFPLERGLSWIGKLSIQRYPVWETDEDFFDEPDPVLYFTIETNTENEDSRKDRFLKKQPKESMVPEVIEIGLSRDGALIFFKPEDVSQAEVFESFTEELPKFLPAIEDQRALAAESAAKETRRYNAIRSDISTTFETRHVGELTASTSETASSLLAGTAHEAAIDLLSDQLEPLFTQTLGEYSRVYYSRALTSEGGRSYVVAYVRIKDDFVPQVFYTSKSQSHWRWLPGTDESGWHSKGDDEAMMAPIPEVQEALYRVASEASTSTDQDRLDLLLADSRLLPRVTKGDAETNPPMSRYYSVQLGPATEPSRRPDFTIPTATHYRPDTALYGDTYNDSYGSVDGEWQYTFGHNAAGIAWLISAGAETGPIRLNGLMPDRQISLKDSPNLGSPGYEYAHLVNQKAGHDLTGVGSYGNNFGALAASTIIQEYYRTIPRDRLSFMEEMSPDVMPNAYLTLACMEVKSRAEIASYSDEITYVLYNVASQLVHSAEDIGVISEALHFIETMQRLRPSDARPGERTIVKPMEPIALDSLEYQNLIVLLKETQFQKVTTKQEKHDDSVLYEYWSSPLFPGKQYVITVQDAQIIDLSPLYVG